MSVGVNQVRTKHQTARIYSEDRLDDYTTERRFIRRVPKPSAGKTNVQASRSAAGGRWIVSTPRIEAPPSPNGTGDQSVHFLRLRLGDGLLPLLRLGDAAAALMWRGGE